MRNNYTLGKLFKPVENKSKLIKKFTFKTITHFEIKNKGYNSINI